MTIDDLDCVTGGGRIACQEARRDEAEAAGEAKASHEAPASHWPALIAGYFQRRRVEQAAVRSGDAQYAAQRACNPKLRKWQSTP